MNLKIQFANQVTLAVALTFFMATPFVLASDAVDYVKDVMPVLQKHCIACHTNDEAQGGLVMETYASLMRGGESGPALTPGVPSSSRMFLMASGKLEPVMPPDDAERPKEEELAILSSWIEQGAKGPKGEVAMRRELQTPDFPTALDAKRPITAIAISPDGLTYVTAGYGDVALFSKETKSQVRKFESQPGKINSIRFNRDGSKLLIASGVTGLYGIAAIYDVATGNRVSTLEGHSDVIQIAIFSPDEKSIATASYDREIYVWDIATGKVKQRFLGHNGAIYSLAFSPEGKVLVSGCADETVKVWDVASGARLDTMSQPTAEVCSVAVTSDGSSVIAGSADNRLRVWKFVSKDAPKINPIVVTRFVDESPLTHMALTQDGSRLVVVSEAGNVKVLRTSDWSQFATLEPLGETASDLAVAADGESLMISLMNGELVYRTLPKINSDDATTIQEKDVKPVYIDVGALQMVDESAARKEQSLAESTDSSAPIQLLRGSEVSGEISKEGEEDWFAFEARQGEMWVAETDTNGLKSKLDTVLEIRNEGADPILRTRLQATRDSYFTFRGKNSIQSDDFRIFAWEEMNLGEYLYSAGEVNRLWLAPRGSDSGFDVFPGRGNRWAYFGTSGTTHAMGEPAYVVRPLESDESPAANGLPVFNLYYQNDDDPSQNRGDDSYVLFKTPASGTYLIRIRDARDEGGEGYKYRLRLRPASPSFTASVTPIKAPLLRGAGRELQVIVDRKDGYDGEVIFEIGDLPEGVHSNFPVRVQPGQSFATGNVWADASASDIAKSVSPRVTAHATIDGRIVERNAGGAGNLTIKDRPEATLQIVRDSRDGDDKSHQDGATIQIRRGETISLIVKADRKESFTKEIPLGKEQAGRNMPHGVYVDNIGLNGLLVRQDESERQFFVTADAIAELGVRDFFLTGAIDGNITSKPVKLEVLP
jgi:mono/diheme cytochrome c family protein